MSRMHRMILATAALIGVTAAITAPADAAPTIAKWRHVHDTTGVAIEINQVTRGELRGLIHKYARVADNGRNAGLAVLYRNTETGAWRCEVYVLDSADSETVEHEVRHCHGWSHN